MNYEQLILQLGVSGALIWAFVKVGLRFVDRWSTAEAQRTEVLGKGLESINTKVDAHHTADLGAHSELSTDIGRIEGKLDAVHGFTPVRGIPRISGERKPSRGDFHDGEDE